MITVRHPTDRPNFTVVEIGPIELYFSYETVVGYRTEEEGVVLSENVWGVTTGKHLNFIDSHKPSRLPHDQFVGRLGKLYQRISIS